MSDKDGKPNSRGEGKFTPFDIWEKGGLTEHLGGINASKRLLDACSLTKGRQILDIGCGTGYTACYLAENYQAKVIALDINQTSITEARKRVSRQRLNGQVKFIRADAHLLPFADAVFDLVVIESVLAFCDAAAVIGKIYLVLKPDSTLGFNELTFLKPPPARLASLLTGTFGIHAYKQGEWGSILRNAGYVNITSTVRKINLWDQLISHMKADGLKNYLAAIAAGVSDRSIRGIFFKKEMLAVAFDFLPYIGYGIYTGKKT